MDILAANPELFVWLGLLGLVVGSLTGMFGIGGAFITTPVMIALIGFEESMAVGCSMAFTLANGSFAMYRHRKHGHHEPVAMWSIALAACLGTVIGYLFHHALADAAGDDFGRVINGSFCVILIPLALVVWIQSNRAEGQAWISRFRIPPMTNLRQSGLPPVSITLLFLSGFAIGTAKGLLGIGGGIILVPFLILLVGLAPVRAVGVSLFMVASSSAIGTALYAWGGNVNLIVVAIMLAGSFIGVILGSRASVKTSPRLMKRLLATLMVAFSGYLLLFEVL